MLIPGVVAAVAALLFLFVESALGPLGPFVKMIPAAALGVMVFRAPARVGKNIAAIGLLVSALADGVIEWSFISGLITFLAAHLFYIAAFTKAEPRLRLARLAPVALWALLAVPLLSSGAGALRVPVLIYAAVIFAMIWRAAAATTSVRPGDAGAIGLVGAILFGVSDMLLGYNRFVAPFAAADFLVIATYWTAQSLIAASFMRVR